VHPERLPISIVLPTLNRRELLAQALDSIGADPALEVIVVDGGSTDGTIEMLARRESVTLLDDRRRGLYDAIDQGVAHASGAVIMLLGSDDLLAPGAVAAVRTGFARAPEADAVSGRAEFFDDEGGAVIVVEDERDLRLDAHAALIGASIINARAFRLDVFRRIGGFGTSYPTVADRAFLARFVAGELVNATLDATLYRYRRHAGSLTFAKHAGEDLNFRTELLGFARDVARWATPGSDLHAKALALEGRCLAGQMVRRAREGDVWGALRSAFGTDPGAVVHPLFALARGAVDRAATGDRR
jgi:glycosyltransferase involved in cell wall biosynthesis